MLSIVVCLCSLSHPGYVLALNVNLLEVKCQMIKHRNVTSTNKLHDGHIAIINFLYQCLSMMKTELQAYLFL